MIRSTANSCSWQFGACLRNIPDGFAVTLSKTISINHATTRCSRSNLYHDSVDNDCSGSATRISTNNSKFARWRTHCVLENKEGRVIHIASSSVRIYFDEWKRFMRTHLLRRVLTQRNSKKLSLRPAIECSDDKKKSYWGIFCSLQEFLQHLAPRSLISWPRRWYHGVLL